MNHSFKDLGVKTLPRAVGGLVLLLGVLFSAATVGATCSTGPPEWQRLLEPARTAENARDWPAAEALYREILRLQTGDRCLYASMRQFAWLQLGEVLSEQGQFEAAIAAYQTSLSEGNDDGRTRAALEHTQERRDAADLAIARGLATIQQDPDSPWGYRDLIEGLGQRRQVERAWDLVDDRLGSSATVARSLLLAQAAKDKGHLRAAMEVYRQILARYAQASTTDLFALYAGWLEAIDPATPLAEGVALYREALRHYPNYFPWHRDLAQRLVSGGQLKEAITVYEDWITAQPADVSAYLEFGQLLQAHGQPQAAIDRYLAAIRLAPRRGPSDRRCHVVRVSAYELLVQLLQREGRLDELLALVEGGQPVVAAEIYGNLALALGYRGEAARAERLRDRLKALYPAAEGVESGGCGWDEF